MKKVYICAPFGSRESIERVKRYAEFALRSGCAPVVPQLYALCLDGEKEKERNIAMTAGLSLLWFCDEMWIFGDEATEGMQTEVRFCKNLNIKMKRVRDQEINKKLGGKML